MRNGKIILLSGTSSAGKTSIAQTLHKQIEEPFIFLSTDHFLCALPNQIFGLDISPKHYKPNGFNWCIPVNRDLKKELSKRIPENHTSIRALIDAYNNAVDELGISEQIIQKGVRIEMGTVVQCLISGMHHAIADLARAGNNIIFDYVLLEQTWLSECVNLLQNFHVLFVGVRCPIDTVTQRERDRGNRFIGQAKGHFKESHAHNIYDLEVDTSQKSPEECAQKIRTHLQQAAKPEVFKQLYNR